MKKVIDASSTGVKPVYKEKAKDCGEFLVKKVTNINHLLDGSAGLIPESDLTIQHENTLIQFEFKEFDTNVIKKYKIKPGCFSFESTSSGLSLKAIELRKHELLQSVINTKIIMDEAEKFYSRLHVYEELNRPKKRALLLCSPPGVGKSSTISEVCHNYLKEEGTCVVVWDTSDIRSQDVNNFFIKHASFDNSVKKFIIVIEDIGGGTTENYHGPKSADSSLLNLLDGVGNPFKNVPTLILATTNEPQNQVEALIDRPNRFDKVLELQTPTQPECLALIKFISKYQLEPTEDMIQASVISFKNAFSVAHLQEVVVRSKLDDVTLVESAKQLEKHKKRFNNAFVETRKLGVGL